MKKPFTLLLASLALPALASAAVVVENFDYADTAAYQASAWDGTLTIGNPPTTGGTPGGTIVTGLTFTSTSGFGPGTASGNAVSVSSSANKLVFETTNRVTANGNDTLWFSFLIRPTTASSSNTPVFRLQESAISGGYDIAQFGFNSSGAFYANSNYWNASQSGGTMTLDNTYFVVGKITSSTTGNDSASFVVYADNSAVATSEGGIAWTFTGSRDRNDGRGTAVIDLRTENGGGNTGIDAIRIGNSFDAVVVPEPSTYALLAGLATLGLVMWRRRRA